MRRPTHAPPGPADVTARGQDGTDGSSQHRQGTCPTMAGSNGDCRRPRSRAYASTAVTGSTASPRISPRRLTSTDGILGTRTVLACARKRTLRPSSPRKNPPSFRGEQAADVIAGTKVDLVGADRPDRPGRPPARPATSRQSPRRQRRDLQRTPAARPSTAEPAQASLRRVHRRVAPRIGAASYLRPAPAYRRQLLSPTPSRSRSRSWGRATSFGLGEPRCRRSPRRIVRPGPSSAPYPPNRYSCSSAGISRRSGSRDACARPR
jgi:hypothetical protein